MTKPKKTAGGLSALTSSFYHLANEKAITRGVSALFKLNKPGGADCPGCAWPDPKHTSVAEFCENGVKAIAAETTKKQVTPEFFQKHPVSELLQKDGYWLEQQGRLVHPMYYNKNQDKYQPVSWEDAFALIGKKINESSPEELVFYTSGRTSNEAAFLYQLFGRMLGTNNFPDCSNMCHESSGVAMTESIGVGKGTVTLEDFDLAEAIFVIGQNPGTNHPRMLTSLEKAAKRGCKIITINPLKERALESFIHPQNIVETILNQSTPISTHYYQPNIGGDLAIFKGIIKAVLEKEKLRPGQIDHEFIETHTTGFQELTGDVENTAWELISENAGLSELQIKEIADLYLNSNKTIICWAMGLTQHKDAVITIQYLVNLLLLKGNIGKPGAGACPVRGHSNVQGDRTMGITEKPTDWFLNALEKEFNFVAPPATWI